MRCRKGSLAMTVLEQVSAAVGGDCVERETAAAVGGAGAAEAIAAGRPAPTAEEIVAAVRTIHVAHLHEWAWNPRKTFGASALAELTQSIGAKGILSPLLVRPAPGGPEGEYQVVCGARRLRAAKDAGVAVVPAIVREDLDDATALEISVVENLQRQDVDPLEEADGFRALVKAGRSAGAVAAKVGKAVSYVRTRMVLADLPDGGRELLARGQIGVASAIEVARVRDPKARQAIVNFLKEFRCRGDGIASRNNVADAVKMHALVPIATAPFDPTDTGLSPRAGACSMCPKNTRNDVDLFGDVGAEARCMDPTCYGDKCRIHFAKHVAPAAKAAGSKVVAPAGKLFERWCGVGEERRVAHQSDLVDLETATVCAGGKMVALARAVTVDPAKITVTMDPEGNVRRLVPRAVVAGAARILAAKARKKVERAANVTPVEKKAAEKGLARIEREELAHAALEAALPEIITRSAPAGRGWAVGQALGLLRETEEVGLRPMAERITFLSRGHAAPKRQTGGDIDAKERRRVAERLKGHALEAQAADILVELVAVEVCALADVGSYSTKLPPEIEDLARAAGVDAAAEVKAQLARLRELDARGLRFAEPTCAECGCTGIKSCPGGCWWSILHPHTKAGICSTCAAKATKQVGEMRG